MPSWFSFSAKPDSKKPLSNAWAGKVLKQQSNTKIKIISIGKRKTVIEKRNWKNLKPFDSKKNLMRKHNKLEVVTSKKEALQLENMRYVLTKHI